MKYRFAGNMLRGVLVIGSSLGLLAPIHADNPFYDDPFYNEPIDAKNVLSEPTDDIVFPEVQAASDVPVVVAENELEEAYFDDLEAASGGELDSEKVDTEIIRERLVDGSIKVEREVTLDAQGNYVNHGAFRQLDADGQVVAQGRYEMGRRTGTWTRVYHTGDASVFAAYPYREFESPFVSTAEFAAGELSGVWKITDAQARLVSEIPFRSGLRHGKVIWNHPAGNRMFETAYELGVLKGLMTEYDELGNKISENRFTDGRRVDSEVQHFDNGQIKSKYYYLSAEQKLRDRDDWWNAKPAVYETVGQRLKHGEFVEYYTNGQKKSTGTYDRGQLTGEFTSWFENGQRETRGTYALGQPNGTWTWWHENGMRRAHGSYAKGTPDGEWNSWMPDGKLARRQTYTDGAKDAAGQQTRDANSVLTRNRVHRRTTR